MTEKTYNAIKNIIQYKITLNNGYKIEDLVQDVCLKLIQSNYKESIYVKLCTKVALNILRDYHRKCKK